MALPVSLESVFQMSFNVVDQIIVGLLGATAVAAVGLSNSVAAIAILLCAAIGTGSGVLIAQAYGRKDMDDVSRTAAVGQTVAGTFGAIISFDFDHLLKTAACTRWCSRRSGGPCQWVL